MRFLIKPIAAVLSIFLIFSLASCNDNSKKSEPDVKFVDSEKKTHMVKTLKLNRIAEDIKKNESLVVEHKSIDDITFYGVYPEQGSDKLIVFVHSSDSSKEEFLAQMDRYANDGYCCAAMDINGFGERVNPKKIMAVQLEVESVSDIDLMLNYFEKTKGIKSFGMEGFSLGGSIIYQYCAYGKRTPDAVAVCSSSPDLSDQPDFAIKNGKFYKSIWSVKELEEYAQKYNPLNKIERFSKLALMVGHSIDDKLISDKGDRKLEKYLFNRKNNKAEFSFFENESHEVPEKYVRKILPFFNENIKNER